MHGARAKLLVPVSGSRNLCGELGSCAIGLTTVPLQQAARRDTRDMFALEWGASNCTLAMKYVRTWKYFFLVLFHDIWCNITHQLVKYVVTHWVVSAGASIHMGQEDTSPQYLDWGTLSRMFPLNISRVISATFYSCNIFLISWKSFWSF